MRQREGAVPSNARRRPFPAQALAVALLTVVLSSGAATEVSSIEGLPPAEPAATHGPYLMAYFTGDGRDGLRLATSADGLAWEVVQGGNPVLRPLVAKEQVLRDPHLLRGPDGTFHLVWTASGEEPLIGYATSADLVSWSSQRALPLMTGEAGAVNMWAPKLFHDRMRSRFMIVWSSTIRGRFTDSDASAEEGFNHRIYYTTTSDFTQFAPARILYDPGFTVIDAALARDGARYLMFVKDERRNPWRKHLMLVTASSPEGPWEAASPPITGGYPAEGPSPIRISRTWFVYFEKYAEHKLGLVMSLDLVRWKDVSDLLRPPPYARHGSVLSVPTDLVERLRRLP